MKRLTATPWALILLMSLPSPSGFAKAADAPTPMVTRDNDDYAIPQPRYAEAGDYVWSDGAYHMSVFRAGRALSLERPLRGLRLLGELEAENVNAFDEVPDSSWFTNRHGLRRMSREALARGPGSGRAPIGPWTVLSGKRVGRSAGFVARDGAGRRIFVKFDDPEFPGMGARADVIVSRFLHAAGYNVPAYYAVRIDPQQVDLDPEATILGKYKVERRMTRADLDGILEAAPRDTTGRVLAGVSVALPGKPVGPFRYEGVREDDPNDTVRHENRRELRGLRLFMAWFNNTDARRGNTLDVFVERGRGRGYLRHYVLDFSDALGVRNGRAKEPETGHEHVVDPVIIARSLGALGLWVKPWERPRARPSRVFGRFDAEHFDPEGWRGDYPNPAFARMTARDAFWAARIIASFTDDEIRTIVGVGVERDPVEADRLARVLIERRDAIARYALDSRRTNPLDRFSLKSGARGTTIGFRDLAVVHGLADGEGTRYRYRLGRGAPTISRQASIPLPEIGKGASVVIETSRDGARWSPPVSLRVTAVDGVPSLIGIRR